MFPSPCGVMVAKDGWRKINVEALCEKFPSPCGVMVAKELYLLLVEALD